MESVMNIIREARKAEIQKRKDLYNQETVINGCHVKIRFDPIGSKDVLASIQSMLISAHVDGALSSSCGGGSA